MVGITLFVAATIALTGTAFGQCGSTIQVKEGETLSDLAERCQTTEARILDLNPKIEGSKDLRAGMNLILAAPSAGEAAAKAREAADSLFARLKSYAQDAGRSIERATETASQSLEEFIQQNPDLHQRVRKLGQRLNIPGMEKVEAHVSLSVRKGAAGTPVTLIRNWATFWVSALRLPVARPGATTKSSSLLAPARKGRCSLLFSCRRGPTPSSTSCS
ncbi:MAG TPA: LysM domain-containing protein [Opitutaceae bacterium]|nr:LysM domain-containing protein [Opitutaceae bacterium]